MRENKKANIANFNCTFGKDDEPMLYYFDKIILPALKSGIRREIKGTKFFIDNVKVIESPRGDMVLTGLIIKRTKLEIKSLYEEGKGVVKKNLRYDSDPYSTFVILLKNHRMAFVKNQNGSPDIRNFASTVSYTIKQYIREYNINKEKDQKHPNINLNIVPIPFSNKINDQIRNANKIKKLTIRLYPLNGDMPVGTLFAGMREELQELGSKTGNYTVNSPKNHEGVINLISETHGTVEPNMIIEDKYGNEKRLTSDSFTETLYLPLDDENDLEHNTQDILVNLDNKPELNQTSAENSSIYLKMLDVIKLFL
ncbi:hypothetical protein [Bacillus sp. ISL-57]|uniref:hypothetical protein n=1 Tax=Bacillus sp. ISL-57 TaxID=2819135 RepID=UPI001BE9E231|nr:hypothetical protein [Bacillus sp. ISL-57]MBT2719196.1 hypothetical protein [Bacillus sp. ISL-57]